MGWTSWCMSNNIINNIQCYFYSECKKKVNSPRQQDTSGCEVVLLLKPKSLISPPHHAQESLEREERVRIGERERESGVGMQKKVEDKEEKVREMKQSKRATWSELFFYHTFSTLSHLPPHPLPLPPPPPSSSLNQIYI